VTLQGSKSRLWSSPEDAIASTTLMTAHKARLAIAAFQNSATAAKGASP